METSVTSRKAAGASRKFVPPPFSAPYAKGFWSLLLASIIVLSGCGGGGSSSVGPVNLSTSGNWQFTMAPPADGSFLGGIEGGFLLQTNGSVNGGAIYSVSLPGLLVPCNTGSATVTGSVNGQTVTLTAVAGTQTFVLNGTLNIYGTAMTGTYSSTAGTASNGSPCGTAQAGLQWSAYIVPPLEGPIQGSFHSAGGSAGLGEQDFVVSGGFIQAANSGASSATITGNLSFLNSLTEASDYPCFTSANIYGQISGNSVSLQIVASDGTELGLIGEPVGSLGSTGVNPVTYDSVNGSYVLHGAGPSYSVATAACPGSIGNVDTAGDFGNICLALNTTGACQQPVTFTPSALVFSPQPVNSPPTTQTLSLANTSGAALGNLTLSLANNGNVINFTETDTCGVNGLPSQGQPFNLSAGQSCVVSILFAPLETCSGGNPPGQCLNATLSAAIPSKSMIVSLPITGGAYSTQAVLAPDFDAEGLLETSLLQFASFSNLNRHSLQPAVGPSKRALHDVGDHAEIN